MKPKFIVAASALVTCAALAEADGDRTPTLDEYCRVAQRIVTRTEHPVTLTVQESFDGFVKSKATISADDEPVAEIQQYNWADESGAIVGVSCKLKSADHLNLVYGDGTAGPDGACQDMNRYVLESLAIPDARRAYPAVVFDPSEIPQTPGIVPSEGGAGPQWLQAYTATGVDASGALVVRTKGFIVDFLDPRFAQAPARFRGVHYCHFIAPDHLRALVTGEAKAGVSIGREVDLSRYGGAPSAE